MNKYWTIFKISLQQEFAYRLNFIMWRARNVLQIFLIFFLWSAVFSDPSRSLFGYDRVKILTYVFGILVVKAIVLSSRGILVANEIAGGGLTNYLLKPVSYFRYWLTRDLSSKSLNLFFAIFEFSILFLILKPQIFLQTNPFNIFFFAVSLVLAIFLFFTILFITSFVAFWTPEMAWGTQFFVIVIIVEFLSGGIFPIDILPQGLQNFLYLTPFPYLVFFPLQIYLGKFSGIFIGRGIAIALFWAIVLWLFMKSLWAKGVRVYRAEGR